MHASLVGGPVSLRSFLLAFLSGFSPPSLWHADTRAQLNATHPGQLRSGSAPPLPVAQMRLEHTWRPGGCGWPLAQSGLTPREKGDCRQPQPRDYCGIWAVAYASAALLVFCVWIVCSLVYKRTARSCLSQACLCTCVCAIARGFSKQGFGKQTSPCASAARQFALM